MTSVQVPEDAYVLTPGGRLGGKVMLSQGGKFLGEFEGTEAALVAAGERMADEEFWPDRVWVSDHGNWWFIDHDGNEIPVSEDEAEDFGDESFCRCGEPFDKDCQGRRRCPECDGPCLCCYDGGA